MNESKTVLCSGQYVQLARRGRWEYAARKGTPDIACVLAITDENELVLCEQYRPPVEAPVIELPAGLVGDDTAHADEQLEEAARRELLEETGYRAESMNIIYRGVTSPGITDEVITLLRAGGLTRAGPGGGISGERITVHLAPLQTLISWLADRQTAGCLIDLKIFAALWLDRQAVACEPISKLTF